MKASKMWQSTRHVSTQSFLGQIRPREVMPVSSNGSMGLVHQFCDKTCPPTTQDFVSSAYSAAVIRQGVLLLKLSTMWHAFLHYQGALSCILTMAAFTNKNVKLDPFSHARHSLRHEKNGVFCRSVLLEVIDWATMTKTTVGRFRRTFTLWKRNARPKVTDNDLLWEKLVSVANV